MQRTYESYSRCRNCYRKCSTYNDDQIKKACGSIYQVPVEVKPHKRFFYSVKWILDATRAKK
ncbi:hypothetical protein KKH82_05550 [Patescibacteria group bacterium]|nr:hypothetical protein [Patescibacteria group bacterium]